MDAAEQLLRDMKQRGTMPDERSYTQLVCGYSELGSSTPAGEVFVRMQAAGFAKNLKCWEQLVEQLQIKRNTATVNLLY